MQMADTTKQDNQGGGASGTQKRTDISCRRPQGALKYTPKRFLKKEAVLKKKQCFLQGAAGKYRDCFLQEASRFPEQVYGVWEIRNSWVGTI